MLKVFESLPAGFLDAPAPALASLLGGPSLIHLPGERAGPVFVGLLLHGNEDVGLAAVQRLLLRYRGRALPRALSLFVGNVQAAAVGMRGLPEQPDYNRIWPTADEDFAVAPCPETDMALTVFRDLAARHPFAAVDLHNNNGRNPHYACVTDLHAAHLRLASRFTRRVLYFTDPPGTLAGAFAHRLPAVTLECGRVGDATGAAHAAEFLAALLHSPGLSHAMPNDDEVALYRSAVRLQVPARVSVGVGDRRAQVHLRTDLEALNWVAQPPGTPLGRVEGVDGPVLRARGPSGRDLAEAYLRREGNALVLARPATPAMFTTDVRIIRQDCLGYLLQRMPLPGH